MSILARATFIFMLVWVPLNAHSVGSAATPNPSPVAPDKLVPRQVEMDGSSRPAQKAVKCFGGPGSTSKCPNTLDEGDNALEPTSYERENLAVQNQLARATDKIASLTFGLMVATFIVAAIGIIQGYFTWLAAKAAVKSSNTARDALVRLEGPYLDISVDAQVIEYGPKGIGFPKSIRFNVVGRNIGRTIAVSMASTRTFTADKD